MTVTRRGVSTYVSSAPNAFHNIALPSGSQVDDLVFVAAANPTWSASFTFPGTSLLNAGVTSGTLHYGAFKKRLTSADITQGSLTVGISTSQHMAAVCVGYSSAFDFGDLSTVWQKDGVNSIPYTIAPAVATVDPAEVLVLSLIKHSGATQAISSVTPSGTVLGTALMQGSGLPTAFAGVYSGTPADRTVTWTVSSSNGVGFQVPVLDTPVAPPEFSGVDWEAGDPSATGSISSGVVSIDTSGTYSKATFPQGGEIATLTWSTPATDTYSVRYYLHTPAGAWPDTAAALFHALDGSTLLTGTDLAGAFNPGQFRWKLNNSGEAFRTSSNVVRLNNVFRVEHQVDTVAGTIRGALFELGSDRAIYDSGVISAAVGSAANGFVFGRVKTMSSLPDFSISRIKVTDSVGDWIGRASTDPLVTPEILGIWNGSAVQAVEVLGVWNGTTVVPSELIVSL